MLIKFRHFKKSLLVALPVAIVSGVSSTQYTGSVVRGALSGIGVALIGASISAWFAAKAEQRLFEEGITLANPPVRPKLILECALTTGRLMALCKEALRDTNLRVKRLETDTEALVVALTKMSFYSMAERITIRVDAVAGDHSTLELSSVPRFDTTVIDGGMNYRNVCLLAKFIKDSVPGAVTKEELIDLDRGR